MTTIQSIFSLLQDYEKRSIAHSAAAPEVSEEPGHWRAVAFRMGAYMLASSFDQVIEITSIPPMTVVPRSEPWLLGVANSRGNLLPIVDFKLFIFGERTLMHDGQRMLVVQQAGGMVAVVVDELFGSAFSTTACWSMKRLLSTKVGWAILSARPMPHSVRLGEFSTWTC